MLRTFRDSRPSRRRIGLGLSAGKSFSEPVSRALALRALQPPPLLPPPPTRFFAPRVSDHLLRQASRASACDVRPSTTRRGPLAFLGSGPIRAERRLPKRSSGRRIVHDRAQLGMIPVDRFGPPTDQSMVSTAPFTAPTDCSRVPTTLFITPAALSGIPTSVATPERRVGMPER